LEKGEKIASEIRVKEVNFFDAVAICDLIDEDKPIITWGTIEAG